MGAKMRFKNQSNIIKQEAAIYRQEASAELANLQLKARNIVGTVKEVKSLGHCLIVEIDTAQRKVIVARYKNSAIWTDPARFTEEFGEAWECFEVAFNAVYVI